VQILDDIVIGAAVIAFVVWVLSHFLEPERLDLERKDREE